MVSDSLSAPRVLEPLKTEMIGFSGLQTYDGLDSKLSLRMLRRFLPDVTPSALVSSEYQTLIAEKIQSLPINC